MTADKRPRMLLAGLAAGALALGGCGSGTKTVSVSSSATPVTTATQGTATAHTTPTATTTATTGTSTSRQGGEATRTTTAPAFTKQSTGDEGLSGALALVKAHGFTASDTSDYHQGQTLRVLVGIRTGSGDGYGQQAFFFVDGRYIGTDTSQPSASVKVEGQGDTEVTLAYPLYRAHDPLCCPGGGQATVHFQLNNGRLVALNPIPPASSQTGLSRQ
ncbi:MAG TPA: LppP/LprE family lipoprotein [Solirubrobacteraceae bacterium]|nr:LppP/LprE family lipoprotein [Solirubrobacteraceae bacterium]